MSSHVKARGFSACISGNSGNFTGSYAPASSHHRDGENYLFADGYVKMVCQVGEGRLSSATSPGP